MLKRLRICEIKVPRNRRTPMKGRVASVARSMKEIGQLNPITVHMEGNKLIAGLTRLRAAEELDWKDIQCNVVDFDKLHGELAEIDENIERSNLTTLEEAQALARRKAIYLELNPETATGIAQANGSNKAQDGKLSGDTGKNVADNLSATSSDEKTTPSFAQDAAEQLGVTERTIRRQTAIGENIVPEAAEAIKDTPLADNQRELEALSKLPEKQQVKVAEAIASGKATKVPRSRPTNGKPVADSRLFKDFEQKVGAVVRMNSDVKKHCGGADHHEAIRQHLNGILEEIKAWRRLAIPA